MKIALLSRWLWEEHQRSGAQGGTVEQLATAIQELGHEVVVLSQSPKVPSGFTVSEIGHLKTYLTPRYKRRSSTYVPDRLLKLFFGHRKLMSDALDLLKFLEREGPFDLLWAQCEEPDGLVAALASKIGKIPPICSQVFALRYRFNENGTVRFTRTRTLGFALKPAQLVIANSPMVARDLELFYGLPKKKIAVLPHNLTGAFFERWSKQDPATFRPEPKRILFFGALNDKKGAMIFLRAASHFAAKDPDARFVVIGSFTEKNSRFENAWNMELKRAALGHRLELLGHLKMDAVQKEILKASAVVLPSLYDEFSRAVVEVLALGRPVITTNCVGASYLIKKYRSGLVIVPSNEKILAWAMRRILIYPTYAKNALNYARDIQEQHTPERLAQQLIELWQTKP